MEVFTLQGVDIVAANFGVACTAEAQGELLPKPPCPQTTYPPRDIFGGTGQLRSKAGVRQSHSKRAAEPTLKITVLKVLSTCFILHNMFLTGISEAGKSLYKSNTNKATTCSTGKGL